MKLKVERTSEVGPLNILELIENNNRITISELSDVTGLSKSAVYSRIGELRGQGLLEREGGTRGRWRVLR